MRYQLIIFDLDGTLINSFDDLTDSLRFCLSQEGLPLPDDDQIRSHLAGIGHPLAGDRKYGDAAFNRYFRETYGLNSQFLHSWQIEFPVMEPPLEGVSQKSVTAKPPKLFQKILQAEKLSVGGK